MSKASASEERRFCRKGVIGKNGPSTSVGSAAGFLSEIPDAVVINTHLRVQVLDFHQQTPAYGRSIGVEQEIAERLQSQAKLICRQVFVKEA